MEFLRYLFCCCMNKKKMSAKQIYRQRRKAMKNLGYGFPMPRLLDILNYEISLETIWEY